MKTFVLIIALLCLLGCGQDSPTEPQLTEEDVARIVAEEMAKMNGNHDDVLTPQEIAVIALKSTVYLRIRKLNKFYISTGFVIDAEQIVTCYHVIKDMESGTAESVLNEKKYSITEILSTSVTNDLAIIRVAGFTAPRLTLGDSNTIEVGDTIYVVGNPKKLKGTLSQGIVSSIRNEPKGRMIQTTAPTSIGSSGSPVLNTKAEVIAIHSETELGGESLNFSVSVNHLKPLIR